MIVTKETIMRDKVEKLNKEIKDLKKKILIQNAWCVGFAVGFISSLAYLIIK